MDKKKYKILIAIDVVLIVGIFVFAMVLKSQYNEQAQKTTKEQEGAYKEIVDALKAEQWKSVDQYGMAWRLVYASLSTAKTEAAFDAAVKAIEGDKDARIKQLSLIYDAGTVNPCQKISVMRAVVGAELPSIDQQKAEIASKCFQLPDESLENQVKEKGLADKFLLKDEGGVKEVACGKNCVISFTFAKGKLKKADYKALTEYSMADNFKLDRKSVV